jgi:hypothetical protein
MSKVKNEAHVTDNYVCNVRRAAIEMRGRWAAAFYQEAKAEGIDLEPIMRRAIHKIGVENGQAEKKKFEEEPLKASTYAHYFCERGIPETFEKKIIHDEQDDCQVTLNYCALLKAWQKMGLDDETMALMCDIAMEGDRGIAEGLGLDFDLKTSLAKGAEACHLCYKTRKK